MCVGVQDCVWGYRIVCGGTGLCVGGTGLCLLCQEHCVMYEHLLFVLFFDVLWAGLLARVCMCGMRLKCLICVC